MRNGMDDGVVTAGGVVVADGVVVAGSFVVTVGGFVVAVGGFRVVAVVDCAAQATTRADKTNTDGIMDAATAQRCGRRGGGVRQRASSAQAT